jgi:hypothetical protein
MTRLRHTMAAMAGMSDTPLEEMGPIDYAGPGMARP